MYGQPLPHFLMWHLHPSNASSLAVITNKTSSSLSTEVGVLHSVDIPRYGRLPACTACLVSAPPAVGDLGMVLPSPRETWMEP